MLQDIQDGSYVELPQFPSGLPAVEYTLNILKVPY